MRTLPTYLTRPITDATHAAEVLRDELAHCDDYVSARNVQTAAEAAREALDQIAVEASIKADRLLEGRG